MFRYGKIPLWAVQRLIDIADRLSAAHWANIVHRDIKPGNVLISDSQHAVVADFGIAFLEDDPNRATTTFEVAASRWFGAPELANGRADQVTAAADVYSMGKVLHWMFTDRVMDREDFEDHGWNVADEIGPSAGEHVNRLLRQMIVRKPEDRLPDARPVSRELRKLYRLLAGGYNAIAPGLLQRCMYCGQGDCAEYINESVDEFGIRRATGPILGTNPQWRVLHCSACGHFETFRVDRASERAPWWGLEN